MYIYIGTYIFYQYEYQYINMESFQYGYHSDIRNINHINMNIYI